MTPVQERSEHSRRPLACAPALSAVKFWSKNPAGCLSPRAPSSRLWGTHLGFEYAALLVEPDYHPLSTMDGAPIRGGCVAPVTIVKGVGPPRAARSMCS